MTYNNELKTKEDNNLISNFINSKIWKTKLSNNYY